MEKESDRYEVPPGFENGVLGITFAALNFEFGGGTHYRTLAISIQDRRDLLTSHEVFEVGNVHTLIPFQSPIIVLRTNVRYQSRNGSQGRGMIIMPLASSSPLIIPETFFHIMGLLAPKATLTESEIVTTVESSDPPYITLSRRLNRNLEGIYEEPEPHMLKKREPASLPYGYNKGKVGILRPSEASHGILSCVPTKTVVHQEDNVAHSVTSSAEYYWLDYGLEISVVSEIITVRSPLGERTQGILVELTISKELLFIPAAFFHLIGALE